MFIGEIELVFARSPGKFMIHVTCSCFEVASGTTSTREQSVPLDSVATKRTRGDPSYREARHSACLNR